MFTLNNHPGTNCNIRGERPDGQDDGRSDTLSLLLPTTLCNCSETRKFALWNSQRCTGNVTFWPCYQNRSRRARIS
jgi:hypothetical protein